MNIYENLDPNRLIHIAIPSRVPEDDHICSASFVHAKAATYSRIGIYAGVSIAVSGAVAAFFWGDSLEKMLSCSVVSFAGILITKEFSEVLINSLAQVALNSTSTKGRTED